MNALKPSPGGDDEFVVLGKIAEAYGLRGQLRIHAFGDDPQSWKAMPLWWMRDDSGGADWTPYRLKQCRVQAGDVIASFEEVTDRTAAESRKGWLVGAPRQALPVTAADEFYWADLIGLAVVNAGGEPLGTVAGLIETGANAVLRVVDADGLERLLPFVGTVVLQVDTAAGQIRVDWGRDW